MNNFVGTLNGKVIRWDAGDASPYIEVDGVKRYITGLPISWSEAFVGVPELTDEGQVGAMAHWGAVVKLYEDGTWAANSIRGNWTLS